MDWAERMFDKGYVSRVQVDSEVIRLKQARLELEWFRGARDAITLQGVVRDKETGRAISRIQVSEPSLGKFTTVDEAGRFLLAGLPEKKKYTLVALPLAGLPYLISSISVERLEGKEIGPIELGLTRGIPFRVRVIDKTTSKPIPGSLNYFPVSPNDPFDRGVMGYAAGGPSLGAFYEAVPDGHTGEYYGAVMSGPGILCFTRSDGKGRTKRGDIEPKAPLSGRQRSRQTDP